ncbi:MAG: RimK family alpha-L-glutamate ligase, partial [bacterium]
SYGHDIRAYVLFDEVISVVERVNLNDFRANVTNGGTMKKIPLTDNIKKIAIEASKTVNTNFAGVDILYGNNNELLVCEVNSNAHIKSILDMTDHNIADDILKQVKLRFNS